MYRAAAPSRVFAPRDMKRPIWKVWRLRVAISTTVVRAWKLSRATSHGSVQFTCARWAHEGRRARAASRPRCWEPAAAGVRTTTHRVDKLADCTDELAAGYGRQQALVLGGTAVSITAGSRGVGHAEHLEDAGPVLVARPDGEERLGVRRDIALCRRHGVRTRWP